MSDQAQPTRFCQDVELVPPGIQVKVHSHHFAASGGWCWTYLSRGFAELGHPELQLTVKRADGDHERGLLRHALQLIKVLYELVQGGGSIRAGDFTDFGPAGLFGADLRGAVYLPALSLPDVERDGEALAVIILSAAELALMQACGLMRVVARLGQAHQFFPYPPWLDRGRASVAAAAPEQTILTNVASTWIAGTTVEKIGEVVTLELPAAQASQLSERLAQLPAGTPFALLALPSPRSTAPLVWRPGQANPQAYSGPDASMQALSGNFVLLAPDQPADEGQLIEDGFALTFTAETWSQVQAALLAAKPFDCRAAGLGLQLRWR